MDFITQRTEFIVMIQALLRAKPNIVRVQPSGDFSFMVQFGKQCHFIEDRFLEQLDNTLRGTGYSKRQWPFSSKITYRNDNPMSYDVGGQL